MKTTVQKIIDTHAKFKNSYFWTPRGNASDRRKMERQYSGAYDLEFMGDTYHIVQSVDCSARNAYYSLRVERNGQKKDIRAVKALLKDLERAE